MKKNAAAKQISTRVIKGVDSPNRNQAIAQGGKEIEISLIEAAGGENRKRSIFPKMSVAELPFDGARQTSPSSPVFLIFPICLFKAADPRAYGITLCVGASRRRDHAGGFIGTSGKIGER